jgi:predicted nucleotidyltransferase
MAVISGDYSNIYRNDREAFTGLDVGLPVVVYGSLACGDYDNDGDLDLAIGGNASGTAIVRVYGNDNGVFVNSTGSTITGIWDTGSLGFGDYDNDGDLDLAVTGNTASGRQARIYNNTGGAFADIEAADLIGTDHASIAWGDYDNDGDLDLGIAGEDDIGWSNRLYQNNNGIFTDTYMDVGVAAGVQGQNLSWGDYDNDGDLDLAIAAAGRIYRNDNGIFTDSNAGLPDVGAGAIAWGDYDNDGRLDLAMTGTTNPGMISRVFSFYGISPNTVPQPPASGFSSNYDVATGSICIKWGYGSDGSETPEKGLYYDVRVATAPITESLANWLISPSTGLGATPFLGNYPHGFCVASTTQPGVNFGQGVQYTTYYWQVRTIDTGLKKSEWSEIQSFYLNTNPGKVTGFIAIIITVTPGKGRKIDAVQVRCNIETTGDHSGAI